MRNRSRSRRRRLNTYICGKWFVGMLILVFSLDLVEHVAAAEVDQQFETLADKYVDEFTALAPVSATALGDHRYDGDLDQVSEESRVLSALLGRLFSLLLHCFHFADAIGRFALPF